MNRFWLWALGAGTLLWGLKALADKKLGELNVDITFTPLTADSVNKVLNAIMTSKTTCPGLPPIKSRLGEPQVVSTPVGVSGGTPSGTVRVDFMAEWAHDKLGPIKEDARQCLLKYLQSVEPKISNVSATRAT